MNMKCYLCGSQQGLTEDHVPAKTFFPKPRPNNLIWVPCCESCHRPLSTDDEAFRTWAMSAKTNNLAAGRLLEQGVLRKTISSSAKLHAHILEHIGATPILGANGVELASTLNFPKDRAERFIVRLTKAMIAKFHPDYDYSSESFDVKHLWNLSADQVACVKEMQTQLLYDFRGDKVFEFWRGLSDTGGAWVFIFYEAVGFVVLHRHDTETNPDIAGSAEHSLV